MCGMIRGDRRIRGEYGGGWLVHSSISRFLFLVPWLGVCTRWEVGGEPWFGDEDVSMLPREVGAEFMKVWPGAGKSEMSVGRDGAETRVPVSVICQ